MQPAACAIECAFEWRLLCPPGHGAGTETRDGFPTSRLQASGWSLLRCAPRAKHSTQTATVGCCLPAAGAVVHTGGCIAGFAAAAARRPPCVALLPIVHREHAATRCHLRRPVWAPRVHDAVSLLESLPKHLQVSPAGRMHAVGRPGCMLMHCHPLCLAQQLRLSVSMPHQPQHACTHLILCGSQLRRCLSPALTTFHLQGV